MDPDKQLQKMSFGFSEDGRTIEIRFHRKDGTVARIQCPFDSLSFVAMQVEQAQGKAWQLQKEHLKGADPRGIYPVRVKKLDHIEGGVGSGGVREITFVLDSGLRISVAFDQDAMEELESWVAKLKSYDPPTPRRDN